MLTTTCSHAVTAKYGAWRSYTSGLMCEEQVYWGEPEWAPHLRSVHRRCLYVATYICVCHMSCRKFLFDPTKMVVVCEHIFAAESLTWHGILIEMKTTCSLPYSTPTGMTLWISASNIPYAFSRTKLCRWRIFTIFVGFIFPDAQVPNIILHIYTLYYICNIILV